MKAARTGVFASLSVTTLLAAGTAFATPHAPPAGYTPAELAVIYTLSPLGAPPSDPTDRVADDRRAARLGQYLFFDSALSANDAIACSTCHQPARAYTDGRRVAKGLGLGMRNVPTLLDAAYNHWFFWDGRVDSLWSQVLQVVENPNEMGSDRLHTAHLIYADPALRHAYEQVFGPMPPLADKGRFPAHARPDADPQAPLAHAWHAMTPAD